MYLKYLLLALPVVKALGLSVEAVQVMCLVSWVHVCLHQKLDNQLHHSEPIRERIRIPYVAYPEPCYRVLLIVGLLMQAAVAEASLYAQFPDHGLQMH